MCNYYKSVRSYIILFAELRSIVTPSMKCDEQFEGASSGVMVRSMVDEAPMAEVTR